MKKRRNRNLLQRMMAVLLSAVLVAGTAYGAFPVNVLAKEDVGDNTAVVTEEGTGAALDGEETEAVPAAAEADAEEQEKIVAEKQEGEQGQEPEEPSVPKEEVTEEQEGGQGQESQEPTVPAEEVSEDTDEIDETDGGGG